MRSPLFLRVGSGVEEPTSGSLAPIRGLGAILPLTLLLVWEAAVRAGWWPETLIAPPSQVLLDSVRLLRDGTLVSHIVVSLGRLLAGFAIGVSAALIIGSLVGLSIVADRLLSPTIQILAPIPVIAWIPLFIVLLGIGESSKVAIIAFGSFFVVFSSTVHGIRSVDSKLVEVARVYGKSGLVLVRTVLLPAALPSIFTGLHVALGLSWILLLVAEVIASAKGIGWFMWDSRNFSRPDDMLVAMIAIGLLGRLSDRLLARIAARSLQWRRVFQGE